MRAFLLSTTATFALLSTLSSAFPLAASSPLTPRSQYCTNAPTTIAGTPLTTASHPLPPRSPLLPPRKSTTTTLWCAPQSSTYIILHPSGGALAPGAVLSALAAARAFTQTQILKRGDGPVPDGAFAFAAAVGAGAGLDVATWNTNNHQQTWGVLGAALAALSDYLSQGGWAGEVAFAIFDGGREVGRGSVS